MSCYILVYYYVLGGLTIDKHTYENVINQVGNMHPFQHIATNTYWRNRMSILIDRIYVLAMVNTSSQMEYKVVP